MTDPEKGYVLDDLTLTVYRRGTALDQLDEIAPIYAAAYAEAPYREGPEDVAVFRESWPRRVAQSSFRLVVARLGRETVGFCFGHALSTNTSWWSGLLDQVDEDLIAERPGRTFAVIEIAVQRAVRRHGIAHELHTHLLAGLFEERATLLVRPDAGAARSAYLSWAYRLIGRVQPFPDGPIYEAMVKEHMRGRPGRPGRDGDGTASG